METNAVQNGDAPAVLTENAVDSEVEMSLSKRINTATRPYHTHLNRLIVARLPLALPPHSHTPDLYALGLVHFAPIYAAFESSWQDLISTESTSELPLETAVILSILIHLYIPELLRTPGLRADLSVLLRQPLRETDAHLIDPKHPTVHAFTTHIRTATDAKPHVLIAYAWVLYMALFNGGRWIRAQLLEARDSSWDLTNISRDSTTGESPAPDNEELARQKSHAHKSGLEFWHFDSFDDGEDIKHDFKARLKDVDSMLTSEQRQDIIEEAQTIFQRCTLLVEELDEIVLAREAKAATSASQSTANLFKRYCLPQSVLDWIFALFAWIASWAWIRPLGTTRASAGRVAEKKME